MYELMPDVPIGLIPSTTHTPIGFIDSGVQADHPQIKGLLIAQKDFTGEGLEDATGHGTQVILSFLAAEYSEDMKKARQLVPDAGISGVVVAKVIGKTPVPPSVTVERIVAAIHWMAEQKVWVVNISIAMLEGSTSFDSLCAAIAGHKDMFFAVAAGNYGAGSVVYPAACASANMIVVGAVTSEGQVPDYSGPASLVAPLPPAPVSPADYFRLSAEKLIAAGDLEGARAAYIQAKNAEPVPQALMAKIENGLGYIAIKENQPEQAIRHFEESVRLDPTVIHTFVNLGIAHSLAGNYEDAVHQYEHVLSKSDATPDVLDRYARALLDLDRPKEALAAIEKLLELDSSYPDAGTLLLDARNRVSILDRLASGEKLEALLVALVQSGQSSLVAFLVRQGVDVNITPDGFPFPPLTYAAHHGYTAILRLLVEAGARVDFQDAEHRLSALMMAANQGHSRAVALLLEHGASADLQDSSGYTALMFAAEGGHTDAASLLIEKGSSLDLVSQEKMTALGYAIRGSHADIAKLITRSAPDGQPKPPTETSGDSGS